MIAVAVLAAGRGERYGGDVPKPLLPLDGRPLVAHALAAALGSALRPALLVVGAAGDAEADAVARTAPSGVEVVRNPATEEGIATSLHAVIRALDARAAVDGVVVGLADQPLVGAEAYRQVAATYDVGASLAAATYHGVRANPVLIGRSLWSEALRLTGDAGARQLMTSHPVLDVPCDGTGDPADVDTPDDLAALEARCRSRTVSE